MAGITEQSQAIGEETADHLRYQNDGGKDNAISELTQHG